MSNNMKDKLTLVIKAIEDKSRIIPLESVDHFTLISYSTLSTDSVKSIRNFQKWVRGHFGVSILVSGGGYGCSLINFNILTEEASEAKEVMKQMLEDSAFFDKAREANFNVLLIKDPWTRIDLFLRMVEGGKGLQNNLIRGVTMTIDKSLKINAPVTGNIAIDSSNVSQSVVINPGLESVFKQILDTAENDEMISKKQYLHISNQLMELRKEIQSHRPKKSVIESILTNLGSTASIASLADKITPFLPTLY